MPKKQSCLFVDLTGKKLGRLTAIEFVPRKGRRSKWRCVCDCGNEALVDGHRLRSGGTLSCGCFRQEVTGRKNLSHGMTKTGEYRCWSAMKRRCYNENCKDYADYGSRGIRVCKAWRDSFEAFLRDMGTRPSIAHTIDRLDSNGDYEPTNCRWATPVRQGRNRRCSKLLTLHGRSQCAADWADELKIPKNTIYQRIACGWDDERILTQPHAHRKSPKEHRT